MRTCLRQALRQVSELFGNPAFGRSSSHGDPGPHRPAAGPQGWGQEGPASAENQSWWMGQEERVVGLQLTTGTQGQPPSALQKDTGVTVRKGPGASALPDPVLPDLPISHGPGASSGKPQQLHRAALTLGWGWPGALPEGSPGTGSLDRSMPAVYDLRECYSRLILNPRPQADSQPRFSITQTPQIHGIHRRMRRFRAERP